MTGHEPRGRRLFVPFLLVTAGAVTVLAFLTFAQSSGWPTDPEIAEWAAFAVTLLLSATLLVFFLPRRQRASSVAAVSALSLALVTIALGLATYLPCHQGWRLLAGPLGWTLELFVGGVEADASPGAECAALQSPGFAVARTFGLLATFVGAISAAAVLGRSQLDRMWVRRGSDVDAVVGLGPASLELVKALVAEHRHRENREKWIDWRPGLVRRWIDWRTDKMRQSTGGSEPEPGADPLFKDGGPHSDVPAVAPKRRELLLYGVTGLRRGDLRRRMGRSTKTVLLEPDEQNPLLPEARACGATVLTVDPTETAVLRGVVTQRRWLGLGRRRLSLRRLFIVTDNQQANLEVHREAVRLLHEDLGPHPRDVVPRLFVRVDDHRYARRWRLENLADSADVAVALGDDVARARTVTHFSDALSHTDAVAEAIVEQFIPAAESVRWRTGEVVLIGDDPLAVQLLEEVAWQQWCRYEVAYVAHRQRAEQIRRIGADKVFWVDPAVDEAWRRRPTASRGIQTRSGNPSDQGVTRSVVCRSPHTSGEGAGGDAADLERLIDSDDRAHQLVGDPAAVLAVLDRLAAWIPQRLADLVDQLQPFEETLRASSTPNLRTVVLAGARARERVAEWHRSRPPWSLGSDADPPLRLFRVTDCPGGWEAFADDSMSGNDSAVVFAEDRPEYRSAAARLAQAHPEDFVMVRDSGTVGLEHPIATGAPFRFGGSLTRRPSGFDASCVPVDSLARLARQQHAAYLGRWPALPTPQHLRQQRATKITSRDWPALPEFFQEDNVRQHRALLGWLVRNGYRLTTATAGSQPPQLVVTGIDDLVYAEYDRWLALRLEHGWVRTDGANGRDDSLRRHPDLRGRHVIDVGFNRRLMMQVLARLWATGLTVEPLVRLQRQGRVTAVRLDQARTWQTPEGDVLTSQAGDWWVTDEAGDARGMGDASFGQMHRRVDGDPADVWRRNGRVWGREAVRREIVDTPEGTAIAAPGMWIITSPTGDQWPVSAAALARGYQVVQPDPDPAAGP